MYLPLQGHDLREVKVHVLICEDEHRTSIKLCGVPNTKVKSVGKHECFLTLKTHTNRQAKGNKLYK